MNRKGRLVSGLFAIVTVVFLLASSMPVSAYDTDFELYDTHTVYHKAWGVAGFGDMLYMNADGYCKMYRVTVPEGEDPNNLSVVRTYTALPSYYFKGDTGWKTGNGGEFVVTESNIYYGGYQWLYGWEKNEDGSFGDFTGRAPINFGLNRYGLALDDENDLVYSVKLAGATKTVQKCNLNGGSWTNVFSYNFGGGASAGIEFYNGKLYVTEWNSRTIWEYDAASGTLLSTIHYSGGQAPLLGLGMGPFNHLYRPYKVTKTRFIIHEFGGGPFEADTGPKIEPGVALTMSPESISVFSGGEATYTATIENTGNVPDLYTVSLWDPTGWGTLDATWVELDAGETASVALTVSVPADWSGMNDEGYTFYVTAESPEYDVTASDDVDLIVRATKLTMAHYIDDQIDELMDMVASSSSTDGIKNSLTTKLEGAKDKVQTAIADMDGTGKQGFLKDPDHPTQPETHIDNMLNAAKTDINAFLQELEAQTGSPDIVFYTYGRTWSQWGPFGMSYYFSVSHKAYYDMGDPNNYLALENAEIFMTMQGWEEFPWEVPMTVAPEGDGTVSVYSTGTQSTSWTAPGWYLFNTTFIVDGQDAADTFINIELGGNSQDDDQVLLEGTSGQVDFLEGMEMENFAETINVDLDTCMDAAW